MLDTKQPKEGKIEDSSKFWYTWEPAMGSLGLIVDSPYKYAAVLGGATRSANLLRDGGKF
jgi:hypothetical protein